MLFHLNLEIPTSLNGVDSGILDPRKTYDNDGIWLEKASDLGDLFVKNFVQYTHNPEGENLVKAGPQL